MTKPTSTSIKPRKQHSHEFRNEALALLAQAGGYNKSWKDHRDRFRLI
ncbi:MULTISPECIES: hypothetical protein [unclassified Erwinia]|nr:hypothetical protein [Erwinia sp. ErVv1]